MEVSLTAMFCGRFFLGLSVRCNADTSRPQMKWQNKTHVNLQYNINKHALTSHRHTIIPSSIATSILLPQIALSTWSFVQAFVSPSST